ncbi:hypothetical protein QTP88_002020 [Uroleucon formosanum]
MTMYGHNRRNWTETHRGELMDKCSLDEQTATIRTVAKAKYLVTSRLVDGWIKLKWDAVSTIFNIPNPPKRPMTTRRSKYKRPITVEDNFSCQIPDTVSVNADTSKDRQFKCRICKCTSTCINCHEYVNEIAELKKQVKTLRKETAEKKITLKQFLTDQQINVLSNKTHVQQWNNETIMKSLKICFAVGVHGFQYLRQMNFLLPCYSTITRRLQGLTLKFGSFESMLEPLAFKVQQLEKEDRFCVLSFNEMEISCEESYDKNRGKDYGKITLGSTNKLGNKLLLVLLRSVKNNWKQTAGLSVVSLSSSILEFGLNGWKPLNVGLIMSSLSIIETSELLFCNGFDFVLCHRFTQDAVENLFSKVCRKAGQTPNAIQSLRTLKMILMSQYISDVKHSYMDDSDEFLLNHFKKVPENFNNTFIDILHPTYNVKSLELLYYVENISGALKILPEFDMNIVFYLAGSATNAILKVSCNECCTFMCNTTEAENLSEKYKFYTKSLNKGGLKEPCINTVLLMFNCELSL